MNKVKFKKKFLVGYMMPCIVAFALPLVQNILIWMSINKMLLASTSYITFKLIMGSLFIIGFMAFWKSKSFGGFIVQVLLFGFIFFSLVMDSLWNYKKFY